MADSLLSDINYVLSRYSKNVITSVDDACKDAAKEAAKLLKSSSPNNSSEYSKGWKTKKSNGHWVVYQSKKPGLTHLLENGHDVVVNGKKVGRAPAHPHIAQAEKEVEEKLLAKIEEDIESGRLAP